MGMNEGHYYNALTGEPAYTIVGKNGKERVPYAREALELGRFPSATTVPPSNSWGLVNWKQEQAVRAAYGMSSTGHSEDEYVQAVMQHLQETEGERSGSDVGTAIHHAIENLGRFGISDGLYAEHARAALAEVDRIFPEVVSWRQEKTFAHPMGFGGKTDMSEPEGRIVDFKSFDGDIEVSKNGILYKVYNEKKKKLVWDQYVQIATYNRGLELPANVGATVFVSRTHPGVVASHIWDLGLLAKGWDLFQLYLRAWWIENDSTPEEVMRRAEELAA